MTTRLFMISLACFASYLTIDGKPLDPIAVNRTNSIYIDPDVKALSPHQLPKTEGTIQLFTHGRPGQLLIQGEWKDSHAIIAWLKQQFVTVTYRQLNIYGCEFAKGKKGEQAIAYLRSALHILVAGSSNVTGKGGDWVLEVGQANNVLSFPDYAYNLQCPYGKSSENIAVTWQSNGNLDGYTDINENIVNSTGGKLYSDGANVKYTSANSFKAGDSILIIGNYQNDSRRGPLVLSGSGSTVFNSGAVFNNAFPANTWDTVYYVIPAGTADFSVLNVTGSTDNGVYVNIDAVLLVRSYCYTCNVNVAPLLSTNIVTNVCPSQTYNLSTITASNTPSGTVLSWHTGTPATNANKLSNITSATGTTFYAAFYHSANGCYSGIEGAATTSVIADMDTDCDGISNLTDIDDDNDAVLDATEAPGCYYTATEATTIKAVTSELTSYSSYIPANTIDNNASTLNAFNPSVNWVGKELYRITPTTKVAIANIQLDLINWALSSDVNQTFRLQGSYDATSWTDLSAPISSTATSGTLTITNTQSTPLNYAYYRILGVAGTSNYGGVTEIRLTPTTNYSASTNPKPSCTTDTDGDGITNDKDLDSDGDGCPDAKEASVSGTLLSGNVINGTPNTTTSVSNAIAQGPYGNNGLANSLENNDTQTATISYASTYSPVALSKFLNACADTDNDGVPDLTDIDDDNDAVLDATEAPGCYYTATEATTIKAVTSELTSYSSYIPANTIDNNASTLNAFNPSVNWVGKELYRIIPTTKVAIANIQLDLINWALSSDVNQTFRLQGSYDATSWTDLSAPISSTASSGTLTITNTQSTPLNYAYYRILGVAGTSNYGGVTEIRLTPITNYSASANPKPSCTTDTDGDGITNDKDLDSDGDGCSDAKEAGATTSTTTGFQFAATPDVNGNGLNDTRENGSTGTINYTSTYLDHAIYPSLNACVDSDNDGIGDLVDIDDDNDGVPDTSEAIFNKSACYSCQVDPNYQSISWINAPNIGGASYTTPILGTATVRGTTVNATLTGSTLHGYDGPFQTDDFCPQLNTINSSISSDNVGIHTIAFDKPVRNPRLLVSSINTGMTFSQNVVIIQDGVARIGNSIAGCECDATVIFPGIYDQISWNGGGYEYRMSLSVVIESIAPIGTPLYVETPVLGSCRVTTITDIDTDNDGIPDRLDLDSDGDGCPDAKEASVSGTLLSGNVINGTPNTTTSVSNAIAQGPYGNNGLANSLENNDTQTATISYASTYSPVALSKFLNACADTDNDGVPDLTDIDDDNDAVLDATEASGCYYTATEATTIKAVTSELTSYSSYIPANTIDNNASTLNAFNPSVNWVGKELYRITPTTKVAIANIQLDLINWALSSDVNQTFRLQGSYDATSWTDLSAPISSTATSGTLTITNTQPTPLNYAYYRILGVAGTSNYGGVTEIRLTPTTNYSASANPKPSCTTDTDGDGITNDKDLDSDGDGCSDAKEASVSGTLLSGNVINGTPNTTTSVSNAIAQGPYGNNGLANSLENNDTQTATISYASTYNPLAVSKSLNACADTDNDGVPDLTDIDDDNDGVPDSMENSSNCAYLGGDNLTTQTFSGNTALTITAPKADSIGVSGNGSWISKYADKNYSLPLYFEFTASNVNAANMIGLIPVAGTQTISNWNDAAYKFYFSDGSNFDTRMNGVTGTAGTYTNGNKFSISIDAAGNLKMYKNGVLHQSQSVPVDQYKLAISNASATIKPFYNIVINEQAKLYYSCNDRDTDNDGIPDRLDLDSDGDGCPDAKEASVSGTLLSGNVINGTPNTTTSVSNAIAQGPYGNNGLANSLENNDTQTATISYASTYSPVALSKFLNACADTDNDGVPDLTDIDDDNDAVLDATEAPGCYYTATEATTIKAVTSELTSYSSYIPANTIDNNASTLNAFNPSVNWVGKELYRITPTTKVAIANIQLDLINWALSSDVNQTFRLQGSYDATSWTDLSAPISSTATSGTLTITNTQSTPLNYAYYRILGVAGTSNYGGVTEIRLTPITNYSASANPKPSCTTDTDGDGITNDKDLDSDGDGCSDAKEAGATTSTTTGFQFAATPDVNGNGLNDTRENGSTGTINYTSTYSNYAILSSVNACIDFDGDGVFDITDLDDDNDGILDTIEMNPCGSGALGSLNVEFYDGTPSGNTVDNIPVTGALGTGTTTSFDVDAIQNLYDPGDPDSYGIRFTGYIYIATAGNYTFFTSSDDGSKLMIDGTTVVANDNAHPTTEASGTITLTAGYHPIKVLFFEAGGGQVLTVSYSGPSISKRTLPFDILTPLCIPGDIDTDNDGVPNRLDRDSDGDGCPDAIEAGVYKTSGGPAMEGGVMQNGNHSGQVTSQQNISNTVVSGPYGNNGFANSVETSTESGVYNSTYTYAAAIDGSPQPNCSFVVLATYQLSIKASLQNKDALVTWKLVEKDIKQYIVQRSIDGVRFTDIATANSYNNNGSEVQHNYLDHAAITLNVNRVFYRIVSVDNDLHKNYSPIVPVDLPHSDLAIAVYPNPSKGILNFTTLAGIRSIEIFNTLGQLVKVFKDVNSNVTSGYNITGLPSGMYMMRLLTNNGPVYLKVELQR